MNQTIYRRFREAEGDTPAGETVVATPQVTPPSPALPFVAGTASWMLESEDTSLEDRMAAVSQAIRKKFEKGLAYNCEGGPWLEVTFDEYVIVRKAEDRWRIDYSIAENGDVTLGDAVPVRIRYETVKEAIATDGTAVVTTSCVLGPLNEAGQMVEAASTDEMTGKQWAVVIIREGMSVNRRNYRRKALKEAAALYEGARTYTDHEERPGRYGRSVKECVGFLKDVRPALLRTQESVGASDGVFALIGIACVTKEAFRRELVDAYSMGKPDLFGLSHDATCESVVSFGSDRKAFHDIQRIQKVDSVDWVVNPAAGGQVLRMVASATPDLTLEEDGRMLQKMIEAIKASGNAALIAKLGDTPSEDVVIATFGELRAQEAVAKATVTPQPPAGTQTTQTREAVLQVTQMSEAEVKGMRHKFGELLVDSNLAQCALPDILKTRLRGRLIKTLEAAGALTEDQVLESIRDEVETYGKLAEKGIVMPAVGKQIELGDGPSEKFKEALDNFFDETKPATSFKRIYVEFTGDEFVSGRVGDAKRLREAIGSGTFDNALGDSITRKMVKEYTASPLANWRGVIADVVPLSDFRLQRRIRMGGYGNLSIVPERAAYPALTSPSDEEVTYSPAKRGGTESISIEAIKNDDVGVIRKIPVKLGRAAAQTIHEFVWDFLAANPTIYDAVALVAVGHNNIVTTAVSEANIASLRLKIKQQTDMNNGKRLGLSAKYVIHPSDLEESVWKILRTERVLGTNNNDRNFVAAQNLTPVGVEYWTDTNNYFVTADPTQTEMVEIGFVDGREDPELYLQDQPNVGQMFSNDVLTYKLRHAYGGNVIDYRGIAGGIVP